jgi:hypothetical protein
VDVKRILQNSLSILMARSNEGKSMFLCSLIKEYKCKYEGNVFAFGLKEELVQKLNIIAFSSLLELEEIKNSIIVIDEVGLLFDLTDRKKRKQVENILRIVWHNGNRILMSGVPDDFKKFLCSKAKCFIFKSLNIPEMINGSLAKIILMQYSNEGKGVFTFQVDKDKALVYDGNFYVERCRYNKEFDTKRGNKDLFGTKKRANCVHKNVEEKKDKKGSKNN